MSHFSRRCEYRDKDNMLAFGIVSELLVLEPDHLFVQIRRLEKVADKVVIPPRPGHGKYVCAHMSSLVRQVFLATPLPSDAEEHGARCRRVLHVAYADTSQGVVIL